MNKIGKCKKIILIITVTICALLATSVIFNKKSDSDAITDNFIITLNPLGETGSNGNVSKVKISSKKDKFNSVAYAYQVVNNVPSEKEINKMAKTLGLNEYEKDEQDNVLSLKDKKGNLIMVNKESATIEFISERIVQGKSDSIIDAQLSDAEYKKKSDMFLKN